MQRLVLILGVLLALTSFTGAGDDKGDDVVGVWLVGKKTAHVEIFKAGNYYFGKLTWFKEPNDANGKPKLDKNNPDVNERSKPLLNMWFLKGFKYDGDHEWSGGTIYDPEEGKTYSCKMWFDKGNTQVLNMRGYMGISLLGRTDVWTRVK